MKKKIVNKIKVGLIQLLVEDNKVKNVQRAIECIKVATDKGANLVVLPECFNSPYGELQTKEGIMKYAEDFKTSNTLKEISKVAKENEIVVVAGSIPTIENGNYFNTSCTFDSQGNLIGKHQKVHLFDINVPGKIVYEESKILTGGKSLTCFNIPNTSFKVGVGICFDIRFAELAQLYRRIGCNLLIYPGVTGPAHWEILIRSRAIDNQLYVGMCSPARDTKASYVAYGHSMLVGPFGDKLIEASEGEEILYTEIDTNEVTKIREQLPVVKNKDKYYNLLCKYDDKKYEL